jgi:type IV secretory pathway VirB10-like protein
MRYFYLFVLLYTVALRPTTAAAQSGNVEQIILAPPSRTLFNGASNRSDNRTEQPFKAPRNPSGLSAPICPGDIAFFPTGFTFSALLPDAIYSYNTMAPVIAVVEDDIRFRDHIVLPKNTHLVGSAGTVHTLDRVNISWTLAVTPEGCEFPFSGLALSADDGSAGVKGKLEKHEDSIAATIALKSVLTGVQAAAAIATPVEGAVTSGFSSEANLMLDQNVSKAKSLESIYVHERTPIRIFVMRRFIPDPWAR